MAEFLNEKALKDYKPTDFDFFDEDLMAISHEKKKNTKKTCWKLYFDRASNALGYGICVVLVTSKGGNYPFTTRLDFNYTNNVVGYEAYVVGLQATIDKGVKELDVYGDSILVIYQLQREWKTRDSCLLLYHKH